MRGIRTTTLNVEQVSTTASVLLEHYVKISANTTIMLSEDVEGFQTMIFLLNEMAVQSSADFSPMHPNNTAAPPHRIWLPRKTPSTPLPVPMMPHTCHSSQLTRLEVSQWMQVLMYDPATLLFDHSENTQLVPFFFLQVVTAIIFSRVVCCLSPELGICITSVRNCRRVSCLLGFFRYPIRFPSSLFPFPAIV